jgi:hypothetical protein
LNQLNDTPSVKRHAFVVARAFFGWCIREQLIEQSPVASLDAPVREASRDPRLDPGACRLPVRLPGEQAPQRGNHGL